MAKAQANGLFADRLGSSQYAKDVLTSHPTLTAAYVAYEESSEQADQLFLAHAKKQTISKGLAKTGRFLPYWYRDTAQQNAVANNGERAYRAALNFMPDLILMDVPMPNWDGYETTKVFKYVPQLQYIPMIFVTAQLEEAKNAFEYGAAD